jgi:hypothetical protein
MLLTARHLTHLPYLLARHVQLHFSFYCIPISPAVTVNVSTTRHIAIGVLTRLVAGNQDFVFLFPVETKYFFLREQPRTPLELAKLLAQREAALSR